jgi:hypothetical protein
MFSTAEDLLLFIQEELLLRKKASPSAVLNRAYPRIKRPEGGYYGLGWVLDETPEVFHFGGLQGYTSRLGFFPDEEWGYVILCNRSKAKRLISFFMEEIKTGGKRTPLSALSSLSEPVKLSQPVLINKTDWEAIKGVFTHPVLGEMGISENSLQSTLLPTQAYLHLENSDSVIGINLFSEQKERLIFEFATGPWRGSITDQYLEFDKKKQVFCLVYDAERFFFKKKALFSLEKEAKTLRDL